MLRTLFGKARFFQPFALSKMYNDALVEGLTNSHLHCTLLQIKGRVHNPYRTGLSVESGIHEMLTASLRN